MKRKLIVILVLLCSASFSHAQIAVGNPLCENRVNPLGIDIAAPQFSWQLISEKRNTKQTAYEIKVAEGEVNLKQNKNLQWATGKIGSEESIHIAYNGTALQSAKKYYWQVRVWDNYGKKSDWSAISFWQAGLLNTTDWKAKWIKVGYQEDSVLRPSPLFRKDFTLTKNISSATLFITSYGLYEPFINGRRITDTYLTPGFTSFNKHLQYQQYDVTTYLEKGKNATGVALGSGWYRGNLAWENNKNIYGKELALLYQLQITYSDGSTAQILSDESWKSSTGAIRSSEIYHGETIDARMEQPGWAETTFNDSKWSSVKIANYNNSNLAATYNEPVKKQEVFKPINVFKTPAGEQVIDFGQNLVGFVTVKATGPTGTKIIISHAEVLDKEGNFYTANLRTAKQQNTFILKGGAVEIFEPHFTFQGFRYIKIEGYPGAITAENFNAVALYSNMKPTGTFATSNKLLNQLQHNIQWGQKGNFVDVPTDCPQRDERLGWTGDAQVFFNTAAYNMQVHNFFSKWMKDLSADQQADGSIPHVIPNVLGDGASGATGWADAATIIPWNMYLAYADKRLLKQQYNTMKAWVNFMEQKSKNDLWNTGYHFGDWLYYKPENNDDEKNANTDKYLIAQCFFAYSAQLMINTAKVLNKPEDEKKYVALLQKIKAAFLKEYVTPNGRLISGSQTAYTLALNFDMLPEDMRVAAAERLVATIKDYNYHLTTGFLGTPYLCNVLSRFGYSDMAYTLLLQEKYPSWLYPVKMGATTIWERWDGQKPDSTFQTIGMNSFNHYAYGAIGEWMYKQLAGINIDTSAPGYKKIIIRPLVNAKILNTPKEKGAGSNSNLSEKQLQFVNATLQTYYGNISSNWKIENNSLSMDITIPANTTALIYLPTSNETAIKENNIPIITKPADFIIKEKGNAYVAVQVGSGKYHFTF